MLLITDKVKEQLRQGIGGRGVVGGEDQKRVSLLFWQDDDWIVSSFRSQGLGEIDDKYAGATSGKGKRIIRRWRR